MPNVALCPGLEHPAKMEEKLSQHDIASYTAKKTPVSVLASFYQYELGC